jgi:hypothetical protein
MNLLQYALRAYNLLLDLVLLILSPFLGALHYLLAIVLLVGLALAGLAYVLMKRRRRRPRGE